jgi:ornithine--oxo-acid transaminase
MDLTATFSHQSAQSLIDLENEFGANNYKPLDIVLARGQGVWVWDVTGDKYLDMLASYSALNQGHCHPRILNALIEQAQKLTLVSRAFRTDQLGPFYKEICKMTHSHSVLPMNTGAEAVETALKAARKWGYLIKEIPDDMAEIIVCANNFHGRTTTIVGFSSEPQYRDGFGPFAPGFITIPFGDAEALEWAITPNTVAFLVEPIQGEGGIIIPPTGYLKKVREICDRHNILLILDEIQTGLGRTGKLFAEEHGSIESDLTLVGKALSGGFYPISAVLSNKEVLSVFEPGDHGSTFGGNPLACAVAREAMAVIEDENLVEKSLFMGHYLKESLRNIISPHVKEVRGMGLLIGVELKKSAGGARKFCEALMEKGILCKETHKHIIRFAPPLTITQKELDWALDRIESVLTAK